MYVSTPHPQPRLPPSYLQPPCLQLPKPWFKQTTLPRPHPYIYSNTRDNCCWKGENLSHRWVCVPINLALTLCLHGRMLTGWSNQVQLSNLWHHTWLHGRHESHFPKRCELMSVYKAECLNRLFFFPSSSHVRILHLQTALLRDC